MLVVLGKILKPHGLRGWMKIQSFTENPDDLFFYDSFFLQESENSDPLSFQGVKKFSFKKERSLGNGVFFVSSPLCVNRENAEKFQHYFLSIEREHLKKYIHEDFQNDDENEDCEDQWYYVDLIGKTLEDSQGEFLGIVMDVVSYGAGDILILESQMVSFSFVDTVENETIRLWATKKEVFPS